MYRASVTMTQNFVHMDMTRRHLDCHQFQVCYVIFETDTGEHAADLHIPEGSFSTVMAPVLWNVHESQVMLEKANVWRSSP